MTCMPCNPPLEVYTCCQTGCTASESTFVDGAKIREEDEVIGFLPFLNVQPLRCKPTAVLLDLGTISNTQAIDVPFDVTLPGPRGGPIRKVPGPPGHQQEIG